MEQERKIQNFLIPRLQDILFAATLGAAFLLGPRMLSIDSDLGRHLVLGSYMLNAHIVPTTDILSHTLIGTERPPYEWLTQVLFALAYRLAGLDGVILVVSLTIAITFSFVYRQAVKYSALPLTSLFLTIVALAASSLHWLPRPHVVTFLFLAVLLDRLETLQHGRCVPIWQFPVLMLFWANMHGGFIFGFLAWLAYLAGWGWEKRVKTSSPNDATRGQLWKGFLLAGIASVITPGGWGNWKAVLQNTSPYILSQTVETMPPNIHQAGMWPFFLLTFLSMILLLAARKQAQAGHIFLLAGLASMGLLMARNIPLFAIASVPVLSLWARESLNTGNKWLKLEERIIDLQKPLRNAVWSVLFGLGFVLFVGSSSVAQRDALMYFDEGVFPVRAVEWLEEHPPSGQMFNDFNWGGYLLYRLWPAQRVFLDSQTDFYGEKLVREYEQVITASQGWESVLNRYEVTWVILHPKTRLSDVLQNRPGWELVYKDETAIIARKLP